ncbi:GntR family transcriptional regulator [Methylobacterium sp. J-070]|uniref:GntR family transcriptional regulator n=1 Tax=Methylobacterium sp. J-070 TaxID=2836650 RepID=UPI001FB9E16B|nr:GntR family transcriptional regulator [Methylobacterium sp. J-070]MCJ2052043.1 GntR family transcriptional regulator [Methylobacterium sp. J-070]
MDKLFQKPPTAQAAVLTELRRRLIAGIFSPGEQLRQDVLAEELGVSRVPVREALRTLEGEGQLIYEPHRGYFVVDLNLDELVEIYRLRDLLEAEATEVGFPNLTAADLALMAQSMAQMRAAMKHDDVAALTAANRRFHFALYNACRMPRLLRILEQLWDASDPYRAVYFCDVDNRTLMHREHVDIYEAARSGDLRTLQRRLVEHRTHAVPALRKALAKSDTRGIPTRPSRSAAVD